MNGWLSNVTLSAEDRKCLTQICSAPEFLAAIERAASWFATFRQEDLAAPKVGNIRNRFKRISDLAAALLSEIENLDDRTDDLLAANWSDSTDLQSRLRQDLGILWSRASIADRPIEDKTKLPGMAQPWAGTRVTEIFKRFDLDVTTYEEGAACCCLRIIFGSSDLQIDQVSHWLPR